MTHNSHNRGDDASEAYIGHCPTCKQPHRASPSQKPRDSTGKSQSRILAGVVQTVTTVVRLCAIMQ